MYSIHCEKGENNKNPCINLPSITYKASSDRQEVIYWADSGSPATLTDCAVRDRKNWECWYKDRTGRLSIADGEFQEEIREPVLNRDVFDSVRYVPKWKWWAVRIGVVAE